MTVFWTPRALADLEAIHSYIAADNPQAAIALIDRILSFVETTLVAEPMIGRPGRVSGTRELLPHPNYILAYRVVSDQIDILTVRHAARLWPETL